MSRKNRVLAASLQADEVATPKIWVTNLGYSSFKPDKTSKIVDAIVILFHGHNLDASDRVQSPTISFGRIFQRIQKACSSTIIAVDLGPLVPDDDLIELMDSEGSSTTLEKKLSKPVCRVLEKLFLSNATLVAYGCCCQLLLKVLPMMTSSSESGHKLTSANVGRLIFLHPQLPTRCVNTQFRGTPSPFCQQIATEVYFQSQAEMLKREAVFGTWFPLYTSFICSGGFLECLAVALKPDIEAVSEVTLPPYDPSYATDLGESVWMAELTIQMNAYTKQYEQKATDLTQSIHDQILASREFSTFSASSNADQAADSQGLEESSKYLKEDGGILVDTADVGVTRIQQGGLILRGNRCVLVRSLKGAWQGMRIPSVSPRPSESGVEAAIRSVVELCDIDADQVFPLNDVPPVRIYNTPMRSNVKEGSGHKDDVIVYALYAANPPPDGPLEDADCEDEDDLYDWYTFPRAEAVLRRTNDVSSIMALRTMATALAAAAASNRIPRRWGGVFGQEWLASFSAKEPAMRGDGARARTFAADGASSVVEMAQRGKEKSAVRRPDGRVVRKEPEKVIRTIPCLVIIGNFGVGKTSVVKHILKTQRSCSKIVVLLSSLSEDSFDAAVVRGAQQSNAEQDYDEEEDEELCESADVEVIEVCGGFACCAKRGELRKAVVEILDSAVREVEMGQDPSVDYLIVECCAGADLDIITTELSSATHSMRSPVADVQLKIDCVVAVVDAHRGLSLMMMSGRSGTSDREENVEKIILQRQIAGVDVVCVTHSDLLESSQGTASSSASASTTPPANSGITRTDCSSGSSTSLDTIALRVAEINPSAQTILATYGAADIHTLFFTGRYSSRDASFVSPTSKGKPCIATRHPEYSSFLLHHRHPLHPKRLENFISSLEDCAKSYAGCCDFSEPLSCIVRLKGILWLANYPDNEGKISFAKFAQPLAKITIGDLWWASVDRSKWPQGLEEAIRPLWDEQYGDKQNELVVVYDVRGADECSRLSLEDRIRSLVLECSLSEAEMSEGQEAWNYYDDIDGRILESF